MPEGFGRGYERDLSLHRHQRQAEDMVNYLEHRLSDKNVHEMARYELQKFYQRFFEYEYKDYESNLEVLKDESKRPKWLKHDQEKQENGICLMCRKGSFSEGGVIVHKDCIPKPEPQKCPPMAHPDMSSCANCRPNDPVEEKIRTLVGKYLPWQSGIPVNDATFVSDLRELVDLARKA